MKNKRYKPAVDKYFYLIWIPLSILLIFFTLISLFEVLAFVLMILVDIFCFYFMISSLVGYVELRESSIYIKFGFFLKREIPYDKIREVNKERKIISYSMLSLKNAIEHINIKYNKYDMVTVSVVNNDELIQFIENHRKV